MDRDTRVSSPPLDCLLQPSLGGRRRSVSSHEPSLFSSSLSMAQTSIRRKHHQWAASMRQSPNKRHQAVCIAYVFSNDQRSILQELYNGYVMKRSFAALEIGGWTDTGILLQRERPTMLSSIWPSWRLSRCFPQCSIACTGESNFDCGISLLFEMITYLFPWCLVIWNALANRIVP